MYIACSALLAWPAAQLLYARAEARREPRYLLVTSLFWLACGLARGVSLHSAWDSGLGAHHVTPVTAAVASTLCYVLVLSDVVAVISEVSAERYEFLGEFRT